MPETLYGTDAIVSIVLAKIELAARRACAAKYPGGTPPQSLMDQFSTELLILQQEMRR